MKKPELADKNDVYGLKQLIQISAVQILANLIKIQKPAQDFAMCKQEAMDQLIDAVNRDWQI